VTKDELIETLAAIEHTKWADWQKYVHSKCSDIAIADGTGQVIRYGKDPRGEGLVTEGMAHGDKVIPAPYVASLERQIVQPYAMLPEAEKQSYRDQVMRYWPVLREFVAAWLESQSYEAETPVYVARLWRKEMGELSAVTPPDG
jgi:hypothetical protein